MSRLSYSPSGLAHLPSGLVATTIDAAVTAIRIEGHAVSVRSRMSNLHDQFGLRHFKLARLDAAASLGFWESLQALHPVLPFGESVQLCKEKPGGRDVSVWRISSRPSTAAKLIEELERNLLIDKWYLDWGGGLIWMSLRQPQSSDAVEVRAIVNRFGGHATWVLAPQDIAASDRVFHPQSPMLENIYRNIKEAFDPRRILNPGRIAKDL
jgi:glycolate oxidase FAD binding subunit